MIKTILNKSTLFLIVFFLFVSNTIIAQNCTVNANADKTICPTTELTLLGTANSALDYIQDPVWSQIAGPTVQIVNPNALFATVKGLLPGNVYTFRLSATCEDGSLVFDDVTYTTSILTPAYAGEDKDYCQGSYTLDGNALSSSEEGLWTIQGTNYAGVSLQDETNPNATVIVSGANTGSTTLRWTVRNPTGGCEDFDEVIISTLGAESPVDAGEDVVLLNCYSSTQTYHFDASFGGNTPEEQGTWTVVSGPSNPTIDNIHDNDTGIRNLVEGTYVLRWTVDGPCVQGYDEMTITVPAPTADLTNVPDNYDVYCDGRTSTVLVGAVPQYTNETSNWRFVSGPDGVTPTIVSPNTSSTEVTGLTSQGVYQFQYYIENSETGCRGFGDFYVTLEDVVSVNGGPDQSLACGVFEATIPVTNTGEGKMQWQIISGPALNANWAPYPTELVTFSGSSFVVTNLTRLGTYVIRILKTPEPGASCPTVYDDVAVEVSTVPITSSAGSVRH